MASWTRALCLLGRIALQSEGRVEKIFLADILLRHLGKPIRHATYYTGLEERSEMFQWRLLPVGVQLTVCFNARFILDIFMWIHVLWPFSGTIRGHFKKNCWLRSLRTQKEIPKPEYLIIRVIKAISLVTQPIDLVNSLWTMFNACCIFSVFFCQLQCFQACSINNSWVRLYKLK